jgi:hypothetical protein
MRRNLRLASGLMLFIYVAAHLVNHTLGLGIGRRRRTRSSGPLAPGRRAVFDAKVAHT